jgi:hypothetical protein
MKLLAVVLLVLASVSSCLLPHECTDIGCLDGASITLRRSDGMRLALDTELTIDGRRVVCRAPPPASGGSLPISQCDTDVSMTSRELADCHEERSGNVVTQVCTPNGKFEQILSIRGTPARVAMVLRENDQVVADKTIDLRYETARPNGEGCEPVCRQANTTWLLP